MQNVAILGASNKPDRYAYKAFKMLREYDHKTFLVHPTLVSVEGEPVHARLTEITQKIDTLTMYVGPDISSKIKDDILQLKPRRVIFNPGSENHQLEQELTKAGIAVENACTLVLLRTEQFDF